MLQTTEWRTVGKNRFRFTVGFDEDFAARHKQEPYFSVQFEEEHRRASGKWVEAACGCVGDETIRYMPKDLRGLVKWRGVAVGRGPIHYKANASYWAEGVVGISRYGTASGVDPWDAFCSTVVYDAVPGDRDLTTDTLREWQALAESQVAEELHLFGASIHQEMVRRNFRVFVDAWCEARFAPLMQRFHAETAAYLSGGSNV